MGALSVTGLPGVREPFEPFTPGGCHVPNTDLFRLRAGEDPLSLAESVRERIEFEGPSTVAAVIMEPVQNSGGCFTPPEGYFERVREICDQHTVLLISDEVICSWGRLGEWFGAQRFGYAPDLVTTAKGMTSAYAPMGAVIASDRLAEPFLEADRSFVHGFTFGGHPICAAVAMANIDVLEGEDLLGNVRRNEASLRAMLESLLDIPIVGEVRGAGYFQAAELVKDKDTKERFSPSESAEIVDFMDHELFQRGLICRVDGRVSGSPAIQLAPPLVAGPQQFEEIESIVRPVVEEVARGRRAA